MNTSLNRIIFMGMLIFVFLTGCMSEVEPALGITPVSTKITTPTPNANAIGISTTSLPETRPASSLAITVLPTFTPEIPPTPIPTYESLLANPTETSPLDTHAASRMCQQLISYVSIQKETNNESSRLMSFNFNDDNSITFLMWSDRPAPETTIPASPGSSNFTLGGSNRLLLRGLNWNLSSGTLMELPISEQTPLQNPCPNNCPLEVVGVAPDNSWQLVQITDAPTEVRGLWLVNQNVVEQLIPYVPSYSKWEWSSDSQRLWINYTVQDISGDSFAFDSMMVDLSTQNSPFILYRSFNNSQTSVGQLLSPSEYNLAFSSLSYEVLAQRVSTIFSPSTPVDESKIYRIDMSTSEPEVLEVYEASPPFLIDWSVSLQDFIVLEIHSNEVVVYTLDKRVIFQIPLEAIYQMPDLLGTDRKIRTDLSTEVDLGVLHGILQRIAISPELDSLLLMDQSRAWAFSCLE